MSSDYTPIPCADYDVYEIAIMSRRVLHLRWRDEQGQDREERVVPRDLRTEEGVEYLLAEGELGDPLRLRLDRILSATMGLQR